MKTVANYLENEEAYQREGRNWSPVDHEHLRAWQTEIERLTKGLEAIANCSSTLPEREIRRMAKRVLEGKRADS